MVCLRCTHPACAGTIVIEIHALAKVTYVSVAPVGALFGPKLEQLRRLLVLLEVPNAQLSKLSAQAKRQRWLPGKVPRGYPGSRRVALQRFCRTLTPTQSFTPRYWAKP